MANPFYTATGNPPAQQRGVSSSLRAEFLLIQQAFAAVAGVSGLNSAVDTSNSANTFIVNPSVAVTAYTQFMWVMVFANNATTGASVINVSGLGNKNLVRQDGSPILANDIKSGTIFFAMYDGTQFQLQGYPLSGPATGPINFAKGNPVASQSGINLDSVSGNVLHITGTNTITAITLAAGACRIVVFDGALTLTNGANLVLPGGQNITTAAGDTAIFMGDGSGKVICCSYFPAIGINNKVFSTTLVAPAAAINCLNAFSSAFDNYKIEIKGLLGDGTGKLQLQFAVAGSAIATSTYLYAGNSTITGATNTAIGGSSVAFIQLGNQATSATSQITGSISANGMNGSNANKNLTAQISNFGSSEYFTGGGAIANTNAITGFKLLLSNGGNFGIGSTVAVYGITN